MREQLVELKNKADSLIRLEENKYRLDLGLGPLPIHNNKVDSRVMVSNFISQPRVLMDLEDKP